MSDPGENKRNAKSFRNPKGTRDFYPEDLLRRRYITETWRRVALRHGFDEIDGPTFEHLSLYTVKSGEGIVSELFSFNREGGDETYALRPEFTPTLARMYAARAKQLPVPTKWFCIPTFFRAERPQRGRLREFLQWNVDTIGGDDDATNDFELMECAIASMDEFGFTSTDAAIHFNDRKIVENAIRAQSAVTNIDAVFRLLDKRNKLTPREVLDEAKTLQFDYREYLEHAHERGMTIAKSPSFDEGWLKYDSSIVRGLAYYTGTVFEVIAEGERAIAGGGRYDGLVELLGGPPTPAVGFAMGDVVLANLLEDKGLMPEDGELLEALDQPTPTRCEAFVISNGSDGAEEALTRVLAELRRGKREAGAKPWRYTRRPIHARRSYKATKNVGKLLKDASAISARFAVILESGEHATVRDLETREEFPDVGLGEIAGNIVGSHM